DPVRLGHEQLERARPRSPADPPRGRRVGSTARSPPPARGRAAHAAVEPAARHARQARGARDVLRRQHGDGGDLARMLRLRTLRSACPVSLGRAERDALRAAAAAALALALTRPAQAGDAALADAAMRGDVATVRALVAEGA